MANDRIRMATDLRGSWAFSAGRLGTHASAVNDAPFSIAPARVQASVRLFGHCFGNSTDKENYSASGKMASKPVQIRI
jgi:hypothetical protein